MSNGTLDRRTVSAPPAPHAPGVYHGMPFAEYLADPSLSSGGIRDLRVSPLTYWVNSPFNPDREKRFSVAMAEGTAYHKRIFEGRDAFLAGYAPTLDQADHPDALKSVAQLKTRCEILGIKKTGTIAELSKLIRSHDPHAELWTEIEADYQETHAGKEFLAPKLVARIETAARSIEADPATATLFRGGQPEVSIFWEDEETGVPMKARLDYLAGTTIADVKTFSNPQGMTTPEAVGHAMAAHRYGLQAVMYLDAVDRDAARFVFVFVENGPAPNVLAREFARDSVYYEIVRDEYRRAVGFYRECLDRWGTDRPWVSPAAVEPFLDEDFPLWSYRS